MKRIYPITILLNVALLLTGCIKEDYSGCPSEIRVYFTYQTMYHYIDPSTVARMNLYVFDSNGLLVDKVEDTSPTLSPDYYLKVKSQPAGDYRFVAWANLFNCFSTEPKSLEIGKTSFDDVKLVLERTNQTAVVEQPLIFAQLPKEKVTTHRQQQFNMTLLHTCNRIILTTEGLNVNDNAYTMAITDNNGKYNFDMSFAHDSDFKYTTRCEKDSDGQPRGDVTVMRLAPSREPSIELNNVSTQTNLYKENLVSLLVAGGVDFETQHEFEVHLKFDIDANVEVLVDGWQVTENGMILK